MSKCPASGSAANTQVLSSHGTLETAAISASPNDPRQPWHKQGYPVGRVPVKDGSNMGWHVVHRSRIVLGDGLAPKNGSGKALFFSQIEDRFFPERAFLDHLRASKYLNWFPAGRGVARDPRVVCIKHSVQFRFCKKWPRSVWVFPLVYLCSVLGVCMGELLLSTVPAPSASAAATSWITRA